MVIKTFATPNGGKYVYDRSTNVLLPVNDDEYNCTESINTYGLY